LPTMALNWQELGRYADKRQVLRLSGWAVPGMPIGLMAHHVASDEAMRVVLAVVVSIATLLLITGLRLPTHHVARADGLAGFISGILNTSTGTNGPPLAVNLTSQNVEPDRMRGTLAGVFGLSGIVGIALFIADGLVTDRVLLLAACGLPLLLGGRALGARVARSVSPERFRQLTYTLLFGTAISSAIRVLF
jgi:uncharacterized protein